MNSFLVSLFLAAFARALGDSWGNRAHFLDAFLPMPPQLLELLKCVRKRTSVVSSRNISYPSATVSGWGYVVSEDENC